MLEPSIVRRRAPRLRWQHLACVVTIGCGALAAKALLDRPADVRIEIPAPPTVVMVPAPPVIVQPPPPPPPPAPPAPPPVLEAHVGCGDVATIGVPLAQLPADPDPPRLTQVVVSREGCTIATQTASTIAVSFDGGQTFARIEMPDATVMAAAADRVMLLDKQGRLGTMQPGHATVWRPLPAALPSSTVFAAGKWTVVQSTKLTGISDDSGESWRYLELPADSQIAQLDADGHLFATHWKVVIDGQGMGPSTYASTRLVTDLVHPHWRTLFGTPGTPADESGHYVLEMDRFWGCGGSQKLEYGAGGQATEIAGNLRDEISEIRVHTNAGVTFASLHDQLERIDGVHETVLGELPGELVAVDASGAPIVATGSHVVRWTKTGGWRVLL